MRRILTLCILALVLAPFKSFAQEIRLSDWQTISSLYTVRGMDIDASGVCWAATTGGVVRFDPKDRSIVEYRNVGALQSLDCSSIYCDRRANEVYVGQVNGAIDVLRSDGKWSNIRDIRRATQYPRRSILAFAQRGDTVLMATEFGFVLWDSRKEIFIATVDRIGALEENSPVRSVVLHNDSIWVATNKGLAVSPLNVQTLRLPSVWKILGKDQGLDALDLSSCQSNGTDLVVTTARGLYSWKSGSFQKLIETTEDICGLANVSGSWEVSTASSIISQTATRKPRIAGAINGFVAGTAGGQILRLLSVESLGFGIVTPDDNVDVAPIRCPSSNQFAD
ncbi:MAG: hypothetical protein ACKOE4_00610, partial [Candidatus Kapaibacterium sp.]